MSKLTSAQTAWIFPPALICAVLLFVGGPGPESLRSVRYGWLAGHLICFALWSYLYLTWRGHLTFGRLLTEVVVFCLVVGGITEIVQAQVGREPSWRDIYNDVLGGLIAVIFFSSQRKQLSAFFRHGAQFFLLLSVLWGLIPFSRAVADDLISHYQFPLLSGFETSFEDTRWGGKSRRSIDHTLAYEDKKSLRVELVAGRYPGVFLNHFPPDWRKYAALQMHVHNPEETLLGLHLRVHDHHHRLNDNAHRDRYNSALLLEPGWNRVRVMLADIAGAPRGRYLDLQHVAGVGLFAVFLEHPQVIHIDAVRLLTHDEVSLDD